MALGDRGEQCAQDGPGVDQRECHTDHDSHQHDHELRRVERDRCEASEHSLGHINQPRAQGVHLARRVRGIRSGSAARTFLLAGRARGQRLAGHRRVQRDLAGHLGMELVVGEFRFLLELDQRSLQTFPISRQLHREPGHGIAHRLREHPARHAEKRDQQRERQSGRNRSPAAQQSSDARDQRIGGERDQQDQYERKQDRGEPRKDLDEYEQRCGEQQVEGRRAQRRWRRGFLGAGVHSGCGLALQARACSFPGSRDCG